MDDHEQENTGRFLSCQQDNSAFQSPRLISYDGEMDVVRKLILDRIQELGLSMADISQQLGRNETYLQQFLKRGSPRELRERERALLAQILKVSEDSLRGPSDTLPKREYVKTTSRHSLVDAGQQPPHTVTDASSKIIPGSALFGNVDLPVYGTAQAGDGALVVTEHAVDWVIRPSVLLRVRDGYAVIVSGDSMDPALRAGATALINPHLPPRQGDICLFQRHDQDGTVHAMIKEYRGEAEAGWRVRQYNPPRDSTIKKSDWQIVHRVVGSYYS